MVISQIFSAVGTFVGSVNHDDSSAGKHADDRKQPRNVVEGTGSSVYITGQKGKGKYAHKDQLNGFCITEPHIRHPRNRIFRKNTFFLKIV